MGTNSHYVKIFTISMALSSMVSTSSILAASYPKGEANAMPERLRTRTDILFYSGFESGKTDPSMWMQAFGATKEIGVQVFKGTGDEARSGFSLGVHFKKGEFGGASGLVFDPFFVAMGIPLLDEAYLQYSIKFGSNMSGGAGGKLPGLASAGPVVGTACTTLDGTDAWSMRYMFGGNDPNGPIHLIAYPYVVNKSEISKPFRAQVSCGGFVPIKQNLSDQRNLKGSMLEFQRNRWYNIEQRIKLNDPTEADGILQIWVDDALVVDRSDLIYRTVNNRNTKIGRILFDVFHGGNDISWAPDRDEEIYFDSLAISQKKIGQ